MRFDDVKDWTPHDIRIEALVIGYYLDKGTERIDEAKAALGENSFFSPEHRALWRHIIEKERRGEQADRESARSYLKLHRQMEEHLASTAIDAIMQRLPAKRVISGWIHEVKTMADRRAIIAAASTAIKSAVQSTPENVVGELSASLEGIGKHAEGSQHAGDFAVTILEAMERRINGPIGMSCGIRAIDDITRLRDGAMIVLAARPSIGKTGIAMNMATHIAFTERKKVLFFSLEMEAAEIMERAAYSEAGINVEELKRTDFYSIDQVLNQFRSSDLRIITHKAVTIDQIKAEAKQEKRKHGVDVIFLDYLQLIRGSAGHRFFSREQEVASVAEGVKALAADLGIPVVVLAQLGRGAEGNERPTLAQIRESGAIEQTADVIMLLHRDRSLQMQGGSTSLPAEVLVAKNRNGKTGIAKIEFTPSFVRFHDCQVSTWTT